MTQTDVAAPKTPADQQWQQAFDADADAVLADVLGQLGTTNDLGDVTNDVGNTAEAPPAQDADPAALAALLDQSKGEAAGEPPAEAAPADAAEPTEDKSATNAILRLIEQEKAFRAKHEAFQAEREAFEAEKAAWLEQQNRADVISADALKRVLLTNPAQLLSALGVEQSKVSQLLIATQLGDKAPAELKAAVERAQWEARINELETRLQQKEVSENARAEADKVRADVTEYVEKGVSKDCPTVAEVAKVDRGRVEAEIFQEIVQDAAARAKREPNGKPISRDEAARRVEKRWAALAKAFKSQSQPSTDAGRTQAPQSGATNAPKAATPSIAPSSLTPQAPNSRMAPYGLDPDWEREAEAAMRESLAAVRRPAAR